MVDGLARHEDRVVLALALDTPLSRSSNYLPDQIREGLLTGGFADSLVRAAWGHGQSDLTAALVVEGDSVTMVDVVVDMQGLESDDDRRARSIRTQALETDAFPTGSFRLTEPIE